MKSGLKTILWLTGGLAVVGTGAFFVVKSLKTAKAEKLLADDEAKRIAAEQLVKQAEADVLKANEGLASIPTINPMSTVPSIPNLGNLGNFGNENLLETPSLSDYIRMADRYMTWENVWKFAKDLGVDNKDIVGGTVAANDAGIISTSSRKAFGEIVAKFPNWKDLLKAKAKEKGFTVSEDTFNNSQKSIKDTYGFEMAQFSGSQKNNGNFWTSRR